MRIFKTDANGWGEKINFVDNNNVLLGYDLSQSCCESADWFISNDAETEIQNQEVPIETLNIELESFYFDTSFFQKIENQNQFDEGGMAIFRITNGVNQRFIHLYNCHNGYYGHGFEVEHSGQPIPELSGGL